MGQGKDIYEENKRIRAENDLLRAQADNKRLKREAAADAMGELAIASIHRFLAGMAAFHVTVCGQPTYEIRFCNDPVPVPDANTTTSN
jgi:phage terminase Nu1 subunit (DNA packaging protein)